MAEKNNTPTTVPNQKIARIHRDMPKKNEANFLTIKKENLYDTYKNIGHTATMLYLYLAGNKDGYKLSISSDKVHTEMGMPKSTYSDQIRTLVRKGYLVPHTDSNCVYDFYERPKEGFKEPDCLFWINVRMICIHRDMPKEQESNFLLIKKDNLFDAYRTLNAAATILYIYLAGNADGFNLAISPAAIYYEMGYPRSTCRTHINTLIKKGYLIPRSENSNIYDFYEKPQKGANVVGLSLRRKSQGSRQWIF